jgi:hypothetical protein
MPYTDTFTVPQTLVDEIQLLLDDIPVLWDEIGRGTLYINKY